MTRPADPSSSLTRALGVAGLAALMVVTLAHPSATRMHTWPWALIAALVWLLPVALAAVRFGTAASLRLPSPLISAGLALLAAGTLASACASPFSALSAARVWPTLGGIAFFLLLHDWLATAGAAKSVRTGRVALIVSAGGALLVGVSLVGWWWSASPPFLIVRNTIPFGHSTYTAGVIVLLLPWFVLRTWQTHGATRIVWGAIGFAALFALAVTSSRGAVLALVAVVGCAALAAIAVAPWTRSRKLLLLAAAAAMGFAAIFTNPRLRELALHRSWGDSARESNRQRTAMFAAGVQLGRERPLLGWGPGSVPLAYPRVRAQLDGGVDNVLQLHNTPVQLWATLGLTGALAVLLLVAGAAHAAARALKTSPRSATALAAIASLGGYGLFALTDHQFDLPIVAALAATGLAMLTAAAEPLRVTPLSARIRVVSLLGAAALVAAPAIALGRDLLARRAFEAGLVAEESGRPADFLTALDRATQLSPHDPYFQHQAAGVMLRARDLEKDPGRQMELARAAATRLEASLGTGVHEEFAHFNLGWLRLDLNDPAAAARHFMAAARLVPDKGGVYLGLGLAYQASGRQDEAVRAFALEWINDPRSMTSPAWEVPALAALLPAVRSEVWRLYANLRPADARVVVAEAWTRWWMGEKNSSAELGNGFTAEAAAFTAALRGSGSEVSPAPIFQWARLRAAWRGGDFTRLDAIDLPFAAALARRAARHPASFQAFLTAGSEDEPALIRTLRRQRTGYGVLALHPDGPVLNDLFVVQENRLIADFAAELFPPKGWLPGRFLLALLPPDPR